MQKSKGFKGLFSSLLCLTSVLRGNLVTECMWNWNYYIHIFIGCIWRERQFLKSYCIKKSMLFYYIENTWYTTSIQGHLSWAEIVNDCFSLLDLGFQNWSRNKEHSYILYNSVTGLLTGWQYFGCGPFWHYYTGTVSSSQSDLTHYFVYVCT